LKNKNSLRSHNFRLHRNIESMEEVNEKPVTCNICKKVLKNKNSLRSHNFRLHRNIHGMEESKAPNDYGGLGVIQNINKDFETSFIENVKMSMNYNQTEDIEKVYLSMNKDAEEHEVKTEDITVKMEKDEFNTDEDPLSIESSREKYFLQDRLVRREIGLKCRICYVEFSSIDNLLFHMDLKHSEEDNRGKVSFKKCKF